MAIKKTSYTGGNGRAVLHSPNIAQVPVTVLIKHSFAEALATTDILELAVLPAYCKIIAADIKAVGTGATTFNVGLMTGSPNGSDEGRASGSELFSAVAPTDTESADIDALSDLDAVAADTSIGITASAAIAADPDTMLYLRLTYAKGVR